MQQTNTKGVHDLAQLGRKGDPLGVVRETEI